MSNGFATYIGDNAWMIGIILVVFLYLINWYRRPIRLPPGPRGIPIVGYLPFMGKSPERTAYELSKKYGKILTIRLGSDETVFLSDYDLIHKVSELCHYIVCLVCKLPARKVNIISSFIEIL